MPFMVGNVLFTPISPYWSRCWSPYNFQGIYSHRWWRIYTGKRNGYIFCCSSWRRELFCHLSSGWRGWMEENFTTLKSDVICLVTSIFQITRLLRFYDSWYWNMVVGTFVERHEREVTRNFIRAMFRLCNTTVGNNRRMMCAQPLGVSFTFQQLPFLKLRKKFCFWAQFSFKIKI